LRIAVLGAGSIGLLFGTLLHESGNEVTLYNRNRSIVRAVRRNGARVREGRRLIRTSVPIETPPKRLRGHDCVIVTVKAYDTSDVARKYHGKVESGTAVLSLQNGLGNYETLSHHLGKGKMVVGSTTEAALMERPGIVVHTGHGKTWLGEYDGTDSSRCHQIGQLLRKSGLPASTTRDIRSVLWTKAIVNSAINPLSALTHLNNGQLGQSEPLRSIMKETIYEGTAVARAERVGLDSGQLMRFTRRVLHATSQNKSSMLQDIESRKRTEIEQLNGMIIRYGKEHGIQTPLNRVLLDLVKTLERSNFSPRA
jgi:2-dehydropantoate 2-reductase